jgi:hypothetical protein
MNERMRIGLIKKSERVLLFLNELEEFRLIDSGGPTFLYILEAGAIPIAGPSHDFWGKFK